MQRRDTETGKTKPRRTPASVWDQAMLRKVRSLASLKRSMKKYDAKTSMVVAWDRIPSGRASIPLFAPFADTPTMMSAYDIQLLTSGTMNGAAEMLTNQPVYMFFDIERVLPEAPPDDELDPGVFDLCKTVVDKACGNEYAFNTFTCHRAVDGGFKVSAHVIVDFALRSPADACAVYARLEGEHDLLEWVDGKVYHSSGGSQLLRLPGASKSWRDDPAVLVFSPQCSRGEFVYPGTATRVSWVSIRSTDDVAVWHSEPPHRELSMAGELAAMQDMIEALEGFDANAPAVTDAVEIKEVDAVLDAAPQLDGDAMAHLRARAARALGCSVSTLKDVLWDKAKDIGIGFRGRGTGMQCYISGEVHRSNSFTVTVHSGEQSLLWYRCFGSGCKGTKLLCTTYDDEAHAASVADAWGGGVDIKTYDSSVKHVSDSDWLDTERRVVCLQAGCGMGKSTAMTTVMGSSRRTLYIIARITQGGAWSDAQHKASDILGTMAEHVTMYGSEGWTTARHVACTVESLWKICKPGCTHVDFESVFLDEACSIMESLVSPTNQHHLLSNNQALAMFLSRASRVIVSDAHLMESLSVPEFLRSIFPDPSEIAIRVFQYQAITPQVFLFNKDQYTDAYTKGSMEAASGKDGGPASYVCSASLSALRQFELLEGKSGTEMFTGKSSSIRMAQVWANPDVHLKNTSAVCTSACAVGCDVTLPIKRVWCDLTSNNGPDGRSMVQLCSRARNNLSKEIYCLTDFKLTNVPADYNDVIDRFRVRREVRSDTLKSRTYASASSTVAEESSWVASAAAADLRTQWDLEAVGSRCVEIVWAPKLLVRLAARAEQAKSEGILGAYIRYGLRSGWSFWLPDGQLDESDGRARTEQENGIAVDSRDDRDVAHEDECRRVYAGINYDEAPELLKELNARLRKRGATSLDKKILHGLLKGMLMFDKEPPYEVAKHANEHAAQIYNQLCFDVEENKLAVNDVELMQEAMADIGSRCRFDAERVRLAKEIATLAGLGRPDVPGSTTTSTLLEEKADEILERASRIAILTNARKSRSGKTKKGKAAFVAGEISRAMGSFNGFVLRRTSRRREGAARVSIFKLEDPFNIHQFAKACRPVWLYATKPPTDMDLTQLEVPITKKEQKMLDRVEKRRAAGIQCQPDIADMLSMPPPPPTPAAAEPPQEPGVSAAQAFAEFLDVDMEDLVYTSQGGWSADSARPAKRRRM